MPQARSSPGSPPTGFLNDLSQLRLERRSGEQADKGKNKASRSKRPVRTQYVRDSRQEGSTMPPVMMRGSMPGRPVQTRKPGKTRRRYDVALDVPGAELRLPALPQVQIGWRLLSGVMTIALLAVLYHVWNSPAYRVDEAEVTGLLRLTSADVNAVLDVADEPIFTLSAAELQKRLVESFPEFSRVSWRSP
jgi:hypothetical protein